MDGLAVPAHGFKLLSGTGNRPLAEEIARQLGISLCKVTCNRFADGEIFVRIDGKVYLDAKGVYNRHPSNPPIERVEILGWAQSGTTPFELWYDNIEIAVGGFGDSPV